MVISRPLRHFKTLFGGSGDSVRQTGEQEET
jgi:hypothetical protein